MRYNGHRTDEIATIIKLRAKASNLRGDKLNRKNLRGAPEECRYCGYEIESQQHVLEDCPSTLNFRRRFKAALTRCGLPLLVTSDKVKNLLLNTSKMESRLAEHKKIIRR